MGRGKSDKTRGIILQGAQKLFAKQGFAATSVSQIAARANINQSLIYHYFNNKRDLWNEVKINLIKGYFKVDNIDNIVDYSNFPAFLQNMVAKRFEFYNNNPDFRRMYQWQLLENNVQLFNDVTEHYQKRFDRLLRVIECFQARSEVRQDLPAETIILLINGMSISYFMQTKPKSTACDMESQELKQQYLQEVMQMLISCLQAMSTNKAINLTSA